LIKSSENNSNEGIKELYSHLAQLLKELLQSTIENSTGKIDTNVISHQYAAGK